MPALCKEEKRGENPGRAGEVVGGDRETLEQERWLKWENTSEMG